MAMANMERKEFVSLVCFAGEVIYNGKWPFLAFTQIKISHSM